MKTEGVALREASPQLVTRKGRDRRGLMYPNDITQHKELNPSTLSY